MQNNTLSKQETKVAQMVGVGYSDKEIADLLCVSPGTVKVHKTNIFEKLEINKATELAVWVWCQKSNIKFDLSEIKKQALAVFMVLCLLPSMNDFENDMNRARRTNSGRSRTRRESII